jgi:hypothetical protein
MRNPLGLSERSARLLLTSSPDDPIDPHHFVTPARLDIVVKLMFFEDIEHAWIYRRHIEGRTGGREKRSWKSSVQDYIKAADDLMRSMCANGFDPSEPVELGSNLNLRGGAHRIACALALDVPVHVRIADKPGNAALWDDAYMRSAGMTDCELAPVMVRFERLQDAARLRLG